MEGFRQCNIRDGAALIRYFAWLQERLMLGEEWTEYDAADQLESFRKWVFSLIGCLLLTLILSGRCLDLWDYHSTRYRLLVLMLVRPRPWQTTRCFNSRTDRLAVIHYSPPKVGSGVIDINQVYLCDSGAQYLDGEYLILGIEW